MALSVERLKDSVSLCLFLYALLYDLHPTGHIIWSLIHQEN